MLMLPEKGEDWPNIPPYKKLKNFISQMSVVNNCSKRGVKLIDSGCNEDLRQDIFTTAKVYKSK